MNSCKKPPETIPRHGKSFRFFYIESRYSDVKMNIAKNCDIDMVTKIFEQTKEMVKWLSSLSKERLSRLNS
jgi:HEPN domain-containing protein